MKECDKRNSHISSKVHTVYISSNNDRQLVTKIFTLLHSTLLHLSTLHFFLLKIHPTTLHYPLRWLNPYKFPTVNFTSHHCTSPHFTSLHF